MPLYSAKILCMNDISAVGRCSLSVIDPVLGALGQECCMLPTALLSTHTGGFGDVAALSAGSFCARALQHFKRENINFDMVFSGYLATPAGAAAVESAHAAFPNAKKLVDPVCADNGRVYSSVNGEMLTSLKKLSACADIITPNITEAKILLSERYEFTMLSCAQVTEICARLRERYSPCGAVTGISTEKGWCTALYSPEEIELVPFDRVDCSFPGTGDFFAAIIAALTVRGGVPFAHCVKYASKLTTGAVKQTAAIARQPKYGLAAERLIPRLCEFKEYIDEQYK